MPTVSREYKDRLFNFIFGREEKQGPDTEFIQRCQWHQLF